MTYLLILLIALVANAVSLKAAVSFLNAPTGYKELPPDAPVIEVETAAVGNASSTGGNPYATESPSQIPTSPSTQQENPYAAPSVSAGKGSIPTADPALRNAVPAPSFAKAMGTVLLQSAAIGLLNILINAIPDTIIPYQPWLGLSMLVLSFLVTSLIYSQVLPTSFGRAAFVFFIQILIAATVAVPVTMIVCVIALTI